MQSRRTYLEQRTARKNVNRSYLKVKYLARIRFLLSVWIAFTLSPTITANAQQQFLVPGGSPVLLDVPSIQEIKFSTVVQQQYDFSCGSAALATLLTHHYERSTSEENAFRKMWEVGDQDRISKLGFSLFEMRNYLRSINLLADGFKVSLGRLEEIGVPGIALIDDNGYRHFVVVKGVSPKKVLVGDPAKGLYTMNRERFEKIWDGTVLFIRSELATGKKNFNRYDEWKFAPSSPFDRAQELEPLQSVTLNQTRPSFSGFTISVESGVE